MLRVLQFSKTISYEVMLERVAWCNNTVFSKWYHQIAAQGPGFGDHVLHLKMSDVVIQNNVYGGVDPIRQRTPNSMMLFDNVNAIISGNSYIGQNLGGSAVKAISSNITITGNLTICDGYSYYGGGIQLDSYSYLFLKEPLHAQFINNSAQQGSAIFAPSHSSTLGKEYSRTVSPIQISPAKVYMLDNLTDIDISLIFYGNTPSPIMYAPSFNFVNRLHHYYSSMKMYYIPLTRVTLSQKLSMPFLKLEMMKGIPLFLTGFATSCLEI